MKCYKKYLAVFKNNPRSKFPSREIALCCLQDFGATYKIAKELNLFPVAELYIKFKKFKKEVYKK